MLQVYQSLNSNVLRQKKKEQKRKEREQRKKEKGEDEGVCYASHT